MNPVKSKRSQNDLIGRMIGNYEVKSQLGRGGMGTVYLAEHPLLGKKVAIKVMHPELGAHEEYVGRFFDEARAVNEIHHPHIVDILDFGEQGEGPSRTLYFVMEFLDGISLASLIQDQGPLDTERALSIATQIAEALAASHDVGIIHRDLKPDNILLIRRNGTDDFVKVLDFGIAKLENADPDAVRTCVGVVMGTPQYVAPELGEGNCTADCRSDVYSLAVVLYRALTGQSPFPGSSFGDVLRQQLSGALRPPSAIRPLIPPAVDALVLRAMARDPGERFASMGELMVALADLAGTMAAHGGIQTIEAAAGCPAEPPGHERAADAPAPDELAGDEWQQEQIQVPPSTTQMLSGARAEVVAESKIEPRRRRMVERSLHLTSVLVLIACTLGVGIGRMFIADPMNDPTVGGAASATSDVAIAPAADPPENPEEAEGGAEDSAGVGAGVGEEDSVEYGMPDGDMSDPSSPNDPVPRVTLRVVSYPPAADVYVAGEDEPRGRTPLVLKLEPREGLTIAVDRRGYRKETRRLALLGDTDVEVRLRPEPEIELESKPVERTRNRLENPPAARPRNNHKAEQRRGEATTRQRSGGADKAPPQAASKEYQQEVGLMDIE